MTDTELSGNGHWEQEAEDGAYKIASALGVRIEDVAAVVEEIPDGLPPETPVSRLGALAEKSELDVSVERPGEPPEAP